MKMGLKAPDGTPVLTPYQVASLRMILAAVALSPIAIQAIRQVERKDWKYLAVVGFMGSGIPAFLFAISQQYLDSGLAGILNALTPLFTLLLAILFFKKTTHRQQLLGMVIGFLGAAGIIAAKGRSFQNMQYATVMYGVSVNTVGHHLRHIKAPWITALSILMVSIPCALYFFTTDYSVIWTHPNGGRSIAAVATLSVVGTGIANILFFKLTQISGAIMASTVTYLIPIVAVGWGYYMNESLSPLQILFAGVILLGVYLGNRPQK